MDDHVKVFTISRKNHVPRQFVLRPGEVLVIGRARDSDIHLEARGVSARHAELSVVSPKEDSHGIAIPTCQLIFRDRSANDTGFTTTSGMGPWRPLRDGQRETLASPVQVLVPFNCNARDGSIVPTIRVVGDSLPDHTRCC